MTSDLTSKLDTRRPLKVTALFIAAALAFSACHDKNTATSPTSTTTTTTTTVATPTTTELFSGRVAVGGSAFYSFNVVENGTVNVNLVAVGGSNVPPTVWLGLGIGTPSGEDCATTATTNTGAGTATQLTGTYAPGVYCVRVWDIGNLLAVAAFNVTIAHP